MRTIEEINALAVKVMSDTKLPVEMRHTLSITIACCAEVCERLEALQVEDVEVDNDSGKKFFGMKI